MFSPYSEILQEEAPIEDTAEEDEEAEIGMWEAVTWLAVLTFWVSFLSEYLVNAIEVFFSNSTRKDKKVSFY